MTGKELFGVLAGIGGLVCGVAALFATTKANKAIDKSITDIATGDNVDICTDIIEAAVEKAAEKAVERAKDEAVAEVKKVMKEQIRTAVDLRVDASKETIDAQVKHRAEEVIAGIDEKKMSDKIYAAAKSIARERIDSDLTSVVDEYKESIRSIGKVYSSIPRFTTGLHF